jgi:hypothetical protein
MPQMQGLVIGLVTALLGMGGVGYAYYVKQTSYTPVEGRISDIRRICYRLLKNSKEVISDASVFLPKQEYPCPSIRVGFNHFKDEAHRIAHFTLIDVRFVSPVDGQQHKASVRKMANMSHQELKIGQAIKMRAHKQIAKEAILESMP